MDLRQVGSALLLVCCFASPLAAQEGDGGEKERKNAVEVFLGGVTEAEESSSGFGAGIEYNRALSPHWRVGVEAVEISTTDVSRSWLVVVPLYFQPIGGLGLKVGPGLEGSTEKSEDGGEGESSTEFVVRFGAGWEFELSDRFALTPEVNLDLIAGHVTWVYGVSFGVHF